MLQNPRNITPLNWQQFVDETVRRRKHEKLTQREHAVLAGVSIPTMAAFERGDKTLSIAKAFDILNVVGLVENTQKENKQDIFVKNAFNRWQRFIGQLPEKSWARFPYGWYQFDYWCDGDLKKIDLANFQKTLSNVRTYTGWPPFLVISHRPSKFVPHKIEDMLECWLKPDEDAQSLKEFACSDYWCANPNGRMMLIRGYQEDSTEIFPAGAIFDASLPIWRMAEALLHAEQLAKFLKKDDSTLITIHFRAIYTGLNGRTLRGNPLSGVLFQEGISKSDEAILELTIPAEGIAEGLIHYIYALVSSLYKKFGITELSKDFVHKEIENFFKRTQIA